MTYKRKWTEEQKEKRRAWEKARRLRLKNCPEYKEKRKAQAKAWRDKNKDKVSAAAKKYREANLEKSAAQDKAWVEKNRDRVKENQQRWNLKNKTTITNYVSKTMSGQKDRSKKRGHQPPAYTKEELTAWLLDQPNWIQLCSDWEESNFESDLAPSIDRLDNSKGYSFDNIQLITWKENRIKR